MKKINNWYPVVSSIIDHLLAAGCVIHSADDGEESLTLDEPLTKDDPKLHRKRHQLADHATACDEANLYVKTPDSTGRLYFVRLIFGNEPYETIADHTDDNYISFGCKTFSNEWTDRHIPRLKHYMVRLNVIQGDYEKEALHCIDASSEAEAELKAYMAETHNPTEAGYGLWPAAPRHWSDVDFVYLVDQIWEVSRDKAAAYRHLIKPSAPIMGFGNLPD